MERYAVENGHAKAFSQLEVASYRDSINHETYINLMSSAGMQLAHESL